jgi:hypothetical protein
MRAEPIPFPDPSEMPPLSPKPVTDTMDHNAVLLRHLERQSDAAYLAFRSVASEYPGAEWSHVVEPLREKWLQFENAVALLKATWL